MASWIFPLICLGVGLIIIFFPFINFSKVEEKKYSLLNCFPCEMVKTTTQRGIIICLTMVWVMLATEAYVSNFIPVNRASFYSVMILEILSSLGFLAVIIFGLDHFKAHVISDVIFFLGEAGGDWLVLIGYLVNSNEHIKFLLPISIVFGVLALLLVIILLLPSLKKWMYLQKSEENGKVIYVRPKVSILAFTEWLFFIAHLINMILLVINGFLAI